MNQRLGHGREPAAADPADHLRRIRRLSRAMVWACRAILVLLPLAVTLWWATAGLAELTAQAGLPPGSVQAPLPALQRLLAAAVTALPLALLLAGLWQAQRCFALFAQGQVFTAQAVACLRRFAGWVAAAAFAAIVAGAAVSVLLTLHNPPGLRHLAVGIGSNHVFTLFFAALVWLMADVIGQGHALARENESFV